jgi:hypothetical protein
MPGVPTPGTDVSIATTKPHWGDSKTPMFGSSSFLSSLSGLSKAGRRLKRFKLTIFPNR